LGNGEPSAAHRSNLLEWLSVPNAARD
jgi:hypothetical protein